MGVDYCGYLNMSGVRTICPKTCECYYPDPHEGGFFQTAPWGCPSPCKVMWPYYMTFGCGDILYDQVSAYYWANYVSGLKTYFLSRDGVKERVKTTLLEDPGWYGINKSQVTAVHEYITGEDFWGNISSFNFFLGPNISHPNGYVGCSFLTSWEVVLLLNIDLCSTGDDYMSLRMMCAYSCKCADLPINCPSGC